MSIENLANNVVEINPLNLKLNLNKFSGRALSNGQLTWQLVKTGIADPPDTNYFTLLDPDTDLCQRANWRGRLMIIMRVRGNASSPNDADWRFRFLTGVSPGVPLTGNNYSNSCGPTVDEGIFYCRTGGAAPANDVWSMITWYINYNPSPGTDDIDDETVVCWKYDGAMLDGGGLTDLGYSGYYEDINDEDITGIQIRTTDQGSLDLFEYSIYAMGP